MLIDTSPIALGHVSSREDIAVCEDVHVGGSIDTGIQQGLGAMLGASRVDPAFRELQAWLALTKEMR
eukprot:2564950-Prorocentrum_lima.AAC.1